MSNRTSTPCLLGGPPAVALIDGAGMILVSSVGPIGGGASEPVAPGDVWQLFVGISNWCDPEPRPPVTIGIRLPDGTSLIADPAPESPFEPPPCNGPGQPPTIGIPSGTWTRRSTAP